MRRLRLAIPLLVAAAVLVGGFSAGAAEPKRATTVQVGDDFFDPAKLNIPKGRKVLFNWIGSDEHNVIKKKGPGGRFASPTTDQQGVNLKHKFKKKGKYKIICTLHEEMKMTIKVG